MRRLMATVVFLLICVLLTLVQGGTRYAIDYGEWRVLVLQSDDWGLEAWFPDAASADALDDAVGELAPRLTPYATSTLETAGEVDSLCAFLGSLRDADGLPVILQANTVVASIDPVPPLTQAAAPDFGFALRDPGASGSAYARPGLWDAYQRAVEAGVWRMELHGLAHRDLAAYASAWRQSDRLAERAAEWGVVAHEGWRRRHELAKGDDERARRTLGEAVRRFERLAGHPPISFIAPDYHWDAADERALAELGVGVIQGKAEQINPRWTGSGWRGRLAKRWVQQRERRAGRVLYLDRPARLEPYGDSDPESTQGAKAAARAVRDAWRRGEPAVVSIHRIQLIHPDPRVAAAGRSQLKALFKELGGTNSLRFLVDAEIFALEGQGYSKLSRGPRRVYRNFGAQPLSIETGTGERTVLRRGTTTLPDEEG